jgi:hypothetical protein
MHDKPNSVYDNRGKLRLAVMTFTIVVGSALLVQGAQIIVKTATAQPVPAERVVSQLDFAKFKRPAVVPVPEDEVILNLASERLRGGLD